MTLPSRAQLDSATEKQGGRGGGPLRSFRRLARPRRSQSGFTLLEVLVAFTILAVGVLAVAASLLTALKISRQSRAMTHATYLAEQQMEAFLDMPGADLLVLLADVGYPNDATNPIDPDPGDDDEMEFNRRWTIQPDTPEVGVFSLAVAVDWVDGNGTTRTSELRSMRADF